MKNLQRNTFSCIAIVYCLGMVYQLFLVTHFQINQEEITKTHCVNKDKPEMQCNGKCHLKKEILKTSITSESTTEKSNNFSPSLFFVPFSQSLIYTKSIPNKVDKSASHFHLALKVKNALLDVYLPPPQVIC